MEMSPSNNISDLWLEAVPLTAKSVGPFFASVTRNPEGNYTALKSGLIQEEEMPLEGVDSFLAKEWVGSDRSNFDLKVKKHFETGGIFAFVKNGTVINTAIRVSLQMATDTGKNVMFVYNGTVHLAEPNAQRTASSTLPGFYQS